MKWSIANSSLKCWSKAIQTLVSIGDNDIFFHLTSESLTLTTFDATLTASVSCILKKEFFNFYDVPEDESFFRLSAKCLLKTVRSSKFLTKSVNVLEFIPSDNLEKLEVVVNCKYGADILYTINLNAETEVLQLEYDFNSLTNSLKMDPKAILITLANFSGRGVSDLTFKVAKDRIIFKNSTTNLALKEGDVYTEICISNEDLIDHKIETPCVLTFSMSAFKQFVVFAENMKLPLDIFFNKGTEPLISKVKSEFHYEATLTLSTRLLETQPTVNDQFSYISEPPFNSESEEPVAKKRKTKKNAAVIKMPAVVRPTSPTTTTNHSQSILVDIDDSNMDIVNTPAPAPTPQSSQVSKNKQVSLSGNNNNSPSVILEPQIPRSNDNANQGGDTPLAGMNGRERVSQVSNARLNDDVLNARPNSSITTSTPTVDQYELDQNKNLRRLTQELLQKRAESEKRFDFTPCYPPVPDVILCPDSDPDNDSDNENVKDKEN